MRKEAERSGKLIIDLVPVIRKTADLVQEVAAASAEQSAGVGQVSKAMGQVDQVTRRNASAAEELAITAAEMTARAERLRQLMALFAVSGPGTAARHPLARRARAPALPHAGALALGPVTVAVPTRTAGASSRGEGEREASWQA